MSASVERMISATGPETDLRYTSQALLNQLVATGAVQPDLTGLGI